MGLSASQSRFHHRWATVIWREQPWYRRSLNRCVDVRVTDQGLCLQVIRPWNLIMPGLSRQAGKAFEEPIARAQIEELAQAKYAGFPTVRVRYVDSSGQHFQIEIGFTHLLPIPLVSDRGAEFIAALTR